MRRFAPLLLAFVAGLVGAIAGFALLDTQGASTTTRATRRAAIVDAVTQPEDLTPVAVTCSAAFDPQRVYKDRAAGVVTISAIVEGDEVSGSGFVISKDGHVMTNAHVITNSPPPARRVTCGPLTEVSRASFADGNSVPAQVVGSTCSTTSAWSASTRPDQPLHGAELRRRGLARRRRLVAVMGSPFR